MSIISIIAIILLWVVVVLIAAGLGYMGLTYKLLYKVYVKLFGTDEDKSR